MERQSAIVFERLRAMGILPHPNQRFRKPDPKRFLSLFILGSVTLICAAVPSPQQADHILIVKSKRTMTLMHGSRILKTYIVALGTVPVGPKEKQGDHKTPEGNFLIDAKNAHSQFHLALHVSYPRAEDR